MLKVNVEGRVEGIAVYCRRFGHIVSESIFSDIMQENGVKFEDGMPCMSGDEFAEWKKTAARWGNINDAESTLKEATYMTDEEITGLTAGYIGMNIHDRAQSIEAVLLAELDRIGEEVIR